MEGELDFLHLFSEHQLLIFVISSLLLLALLFGLGILVGNGTEGRGRTK